MSKLEKDLSQGSVVKQLLIFAFPFIISNLIQALYSVADMIIVGQMAGTISMSGVNIGSQITLLFMNIGIGMSVGATVLIGQYKGAGQRDHLRETIATLFIVLGALGVALTLGIIFSLDPILDLIKTPIESYSEAKEYLFVTTLGILFIFGYNALAAIMRGMGDSKSPLIFVGVACGINILLDLLLVGPLDMKALGAAVATIVSQAISMVLCVIYLKRKKFVFDFSLKSFKISKSSVGMLIKVGLPTTIQNVAVSLSFTVLLAIVNNMGVTQSAAVGAVGKFNTFGILPALAVSSAISAMVAQNVGAGRYDRAQKTMIIGFLLAMAMSIIVFVLTALFPEQILSIFDDDPELIKEGAKYMQSFKYDFLIVPIQFSLTGLFLGSGKSVFALINSVLSSLLFRIPAAYLLGVVMEGGMQGLGWGGPIASAAASVIAFVYFLTGHWKKNNILKEREFQAAD